MSKSKDPKQRRPLSPTELAAVHGGDGGGTYVHSSPWSVVAPKAPPPSQP
jgi:hypothetical protein